MQNEIESRNGVITQLGRVSALQAESSEFDSLWLHITKVCIKVTKPETLRQKRNKDTADSPQGNSSGVLLG